MLAVSVLAAITLMVAETNKKEIIAVTPLQVRWFTPSYYTDGRQRAHLLGDSSQGGAWIDRAKIPAGKHVRAHTHPQDEPVTVIEGTWYLGEGTRFDSTKLKRYPRLLVCLDCGLADALLSEDELRNLREMYSSMSRENLADMNVGLPPESPLRDQ